MPKALAPVAPATLWLLGRDDAFAAPTFADFAIAAKIVETFRSSQPKAVDDWMLEVIGEAFSEVAAPPAGGNPARRGPRAAERAATMRAVRPAPSLL